MKTVRVSAILIAIFLSGVCAPLAATKTAASATVTPDPVKDCPAGLVCFTPEEIGAIDKKLIAYERDLTIAKAKNRRFGLGATCGAGVSADIGGHEIVVRQQLLQCTAGLTVRLF